MTTADTPRHKIDPTRPIMASVERWHELGWSAGALGLGAIKSLLRSQRAYTELVERCLADFSLSENQYEILMRMYYAGDEPVMLGKLSERLQLSPASITNNVDRLEAAGLVTREASAVDRRQVLAALTDTGRSVAAEATERLIGLIFDRTGLTDDELRQLIELTSKLFVGLESASHDE